jgi:hypothetical protein
MRRIALGAAATTLLALGGGGCLAEFDPAAWVSGLRLLGVKAEPADVASGEMVTLSATTANPGGSAPTVQWDACLLPPPPGTGQSVNQDCIDLEGGDALVPFGTGDTVVATMPPVSLSMLGLPDQTNGFYLPVRVRLAADDKRLVGFYSLRIFLGPLSPNPRNQNPALTGIFVVPSADAGADMQTALDETMPPEIHRGEQIALRALVTPESTETYLVYDGDPRTTEPRAVTEQIRVAWYTTAGTFSNNVTGNEKPDTTLTMDEHVPEASGTVVDLWVVARDERGGSDSLHRTLIFR